MVFSIFSLFAFILVLTLEYIDFKNGSSSFFFSQRKKETDKAFSRTVQEPGALDWTELFSSTVELVDRFLDKQGVEHLKLRIREAETVPFRDRLRKYIIDSGRKIALVDTSTSPKARRFLYHVFHNYKKTHIILLSAEITEPKLKSREPAVKERLIKPKPLKTVAIVIDDVGNRPGIIEKLKALGIPITASILVDEPYARSEVASARNTQIETILHIPMEALNEEKNSNPKTLTLKSTPKQISALIQTSRAIVPRAKGANNHQGSLATASAETMRRFLSILRDNDMYFIDSRTSPNSVAYKIAQEMGVPSAYKDMFIDHVPTLEHSREQFLRLYELLNRKNSALMIGHPHDTTLQAIREAIPTLKKMNVEFVHAADIAH